MSDYLTEQKLGVFLNNILGQENVKPQFSFEVNKRLKYDYILATKSGNKLFEFDGAQHYTSSEVIFRDKKKDTMALDHGYDLIRIPYWLQLSKETIKIWFGLEMPFEQIYPYGFIDSKAILPADFCYLGNERFEKELSELPSNIKESVLNSMEEKASLLGKDRVYGFFKG